MSTSPLFQTGLYLGLLLLLAWPLGHYLAALFEGRLSARFSLLQRMESWICRLLGTAATEEMSWREYAFGLILFNSLGAFLVYLLLRLQAFLPLNPAGLEAVKPDSAFNIAVSFTTNTNWQSYSGEQTLSFLSQTLALTVQNFLSAASGIVVAIAFVRSFSRSRATGLGNLWLDLIRTVLFLLLPLSACFAFFLVSQGVPQTFKPYERVELLEPLQIQEPESNAEQNQGESWQKIAMGPVASQEAIKMLGTNGGGFFNANSAHPFENPTPLTNFTEMLAILLIPAALCFAFGLMVSDKRQGVSLTSTMLVLFVLFSVWGFWAENRANPALTQLGASETMANMEGKEVRFGSVPSILFALATTSASCGAVNAMHDSFLPLGGLAPLLLIQLGEIVFGGVGSGLYGILIFAILAVFLSGLMIGRTPEYLGKKIGSFEMKMVSSAILIPPFFVLAGTALALSVRQGLHGLANPGAHGLSEVLYAFSSAANNNGSAFAGLDASGWFYNSLLGIAMWLGRFAVIVPVLAIAGSLVKKPKLAISVGSLPTHGPLFVVLLVGTILIVGALTYIPALALGPIAEHLQFVNP